MAWGRVEEGKVKIKELQVLHCGSCDDFCVFWEICNVRDFDATSTLQQDVHLHEGEL